MNDDPRFTVIHMRARMHGYAYAHCGNCTFLIPNDTNVPWCKKFDYDPFPGLSALGECLCDSHEVGQATYGVNGDKL